MLSHLFQKRSIHVPTWKLGLVLMLLLGGLLLGVSRALYPFLALSSPLERPDVMVIDGWVSDRTMAAAAALAREQSCEVILATGVDLPAGGFLSDYKTFAHVGEASLEAMGVPADEVHPAPAGPNLRYRTFASASAVFHWLEKEERLDARIAIVTEGPHSRRSLAIYRKVFRGSGAKIGVVSMPPPAYDPDEWWKTSAGIKAVMVETIAFTDEWLRDSGRDTNDPHSVKTGIGAGP